MPTNADRRHMMSDLLPEGMPVSKSWLMDEAGLDRHAIDNLLKAGQLAPLASGVYSRPGTRLNWMGVAAALQSIFKADLKIGGLTALELNGFAHYLPMSSTRTVHLYGTDTLPDWVQSSVQQAHFVRHLRVPGLEQVGAVTRRYDSSARQLVDGTTKNDRLWPLELSSPEKAFLEVLSEVPEAVSFEHAAELLRGMTNLSPKRMTDILRHCTSVKVRRLFYWLAERQNHAWFQKLPAGDALDELGLGRGNRKLAIGGKLDAKYRITVPEEMWTPTQPTTARSGF